MHKPAYSTTRLYLKLSFILAWSVIAVLVYGAMAGKQTAVDMANVVAPSMVLLIASMLGIHRFAGAMDMATMARFQPSPPAPFPISEGGET